jgi:hypothetical protein
MLPWAFSEEAAAEKHMAQLQHNMWVTEPPRARVAAVRIVDMSSSNAWAEFANVFRRTREAYLEHENVLSTGTDGFSLQWPSRWRGTQSSWS